MFKCHSITLVVFVQNNATPHTSHTTKSFFESKIIDLLDWAPCSSDCNPNGQFWSILVSRVYSDKKTHDNLEDSKMPFKRFGMCLELDVTRKKVISFPKQLIEVVVAKGGHLDNF